MKLLYLPFESESHSLSKSYPYCYGVGLSEGFKENGIESVIIPLTRNRELWVPHIRDIVEGISFDQVWIEIGYSNIPEDLLRWVKDTIPVRVGLFFESYQDGFGKKNQEKIENRIPYLTHLVVSNPDRFKDFSLPVMKFESCIPYRLIFTCSATDHRALFRVVSLKNQDPIYLKPFDFLKLENKTNLPALYDQLFSSNYTLADWPNFCRDWFNTKQALYSLTVDNLYNVLGCAFVILPHQTQNLDFEIMTAMASGKPVIAPFGGNSLFVDNEEILYYKEKEQIYEFISWLRQDGDFRFCMADNARVALLDNHTIENRVKQMVRFIGR